MCCASSSKQALIASFSYQVIRHPGREYSASMSHSSMPGTSFSLSLPGHACMRLDLLKQGSGSPVLERLGVTLDAGRDLHIHFAIDRCFQFVATEVFHPGFGVFLGVEVVIHAHPFVQVGGEYLVEGSWQERMFGFEAGERRTNWNGSGGLVVTNQIQMIGHPFSSGFSLISFLLGQFEKTVRNSQVAHPDSVRVKCAIQRAKPPETTFDKVHRATRPVIRPAN